MWMTIGVTLGIAIVGWTKARTADRHADEAVALARSAEERADRLEQRQFERRDVAWKVAKGHAGRDHLTIQNVGSDTAFEVLLVVDPLGSKRPRMTLDRDEVGPAEEMTMPLVELAADAKERFRSAAPGLILSPGFHVRARVTWVSQAGVPSVQEWDDLSL